MGEAEVILRLAIYYIKNNLTKEPVRVSIDGAHVKTGSKVHFDIFEFCNRNGLIKIDENMSSWKGEYELQGYESHIIISSEPGVGDVNINLPDGSIIYAECKKGKNDKRGQEYPLMREAIGQLMTGCDFGVKTVPMVAVPDTGKARELAIRWSKLAQIKAIGIKFALISEDGSVSLL